MPRRATRSHEQELLAIIHALKTWRHYLHGAQVHACMTDHKSLQHFKTQPQLSGRQTRWKDVIADFDFDIEYIEGKANVVADGLSRRPTTQHSSELLHLRTSSRPLPLCRISSAPRSASTQLADAALPTSRTPIAATPPTSPR